MPPDRYVQQYSEAWHNYCFAVNAHANPAFSIMIMNVDVRDHGSTNYAAQRGLRSSSPDWDNLQGVKAVH